MNIKEIPEPERSVRAAANVVFPLAAREPSVEDTIGVFLPQCLTTGTYARTRRKLKKSVWMDATHKSSIHYLVGATDALPQRGLNPVARENRRVLDTSTQYRGRELTKSASCPDFRTSSRSTPQTSLLKFKKTTSPGPPVTSEENGKQSKSKNRQVRHAICVMCNLQDLIASRAHPNNAPASSRSFVPPDPASYGIGSAEKSGFYSEDEMPSPCKYKTLKIKKSKMRQTSKKHTKIEHPTADVIWTWSETENQLDDYGRPKGWLHRKLRTM